MNRRLCPSRKYCKVPNGSKAAGGMAKAWHATTTLHANPMAPGSGFFRNVSPSAGTCTAYSPRSLRPRVYVELHTLSNFSFLRGASQPEELVAQAKTLHYSGLALTDECSLAGVVRAHSAAKELGLPLIIGAELNCLPQDEHQDGPSQLKVVALATDRASYGALSRLISNARRTARKGRSEEHT